MYNFLDSKLKPKVRVDCPATDGYEVHNLISNDISLKVKGFLAYTAIKPPVALDFEFICPVNIQFILIRTTVGTQKTSGLELLVKNSTSDFCTVGKHSSNEAGIAVFNRKYYSDHKNKLPEDFTTNFFKSRLTQLSSAEKLRVRIFRTVSCVPCIGEIQVWGSVSRICSSTTEIAIRRLMLPKQQLFAGIPDASCSTFKKHSEVFSINKESTSNLLSCKSEEQVLDRASSVPSQIKQTAIQLPGKLCSREKRPEKSFDILQECIDSISSTDEKQKSEKHLNMREEYTGSVSYISEKKVRSSTSQLGTATLLIQKTHSFLKNLEKYPKESEEFLSIPEEFIDPISCEMMALPVTLPCGKSVDQSTLEKYQECEAKWGRSPNDPFTGQQFTTVRKPVLNTSLKGRIDEFLLQHSNRKETFSIRRTLGKRKTDFTEEKSAEALQRFNTREPNVVNSSKVIYSSNMEEEFRRNTNQLLMNNQRSIEKCGNLTTTKERLSEKVVQQSDFRGVNEENASETLFLSGSLDEMMKNTIEKYKIVRFTTEDPHVTPAKDLCNVCNSTIHLYVLPCRHFICRTCLLNTKESLCKTCDNLYTKSDVVKHYK